MVLTVELGVKTVKTAARPQKAAGGPISIGTKPKKPAGVPKKAAKLGGSISVGIKKPQIQKKVAGGPISVGVGIRKPQFQKKATGGVISVGIKKPQFQKAVGGTISVGIKKPQFQKAWTPSGKGSSKGKGQVVKVITQYVYVNKGKGKGKGKGKRNAKLNKIDAEKKVWIGGLPKGLNWKKLKEHFKQAGETTMVEILGKNQDTGCVGFKTEEEASNAIAILNGSELEGATIEVDVWTKKEKAPKEEA
jgi:hypothetical protein